MSGAEGGDAGRTRPMDVVHPAGAFGEADVGGRWVEPTAVEPTVNAGGVGVVAVVPALAEPEQGGGEEAQHRERGGPLRSPGAAGWFHDGVTVVDVIGLSGIRDSSAWMRMARPGSRAAL